MPTSVLEYHQGQLERWLGLLTEIVERESPTHDKQAVDALGRFLAQRLREAGASVEVLPQAEHGDFLRAEYGPGSDGQILVLCHIDTVWPLGEVERRPVYQENGKIHGPGVFDMKCGVMFTLAALTAMKELGLSSRRKIVLLYNTEEEIGSPASRPVIEAEARRSDLVLVLEPTVPPYGAIKTARKGVGRFKLKVTGRPSHSGSDHKGGVSALEELSRQILKLHAMTDYETGTTVNVGVASGGTRPNVVAAEAHAEIDLRVTSIRAGEEATGAILGLTPFHPEATVEVTGQMNRPPMERTAAIERLYLHARDLAAGVGFDLPEAATGGGSDGNFTAALGAPTLDGLGAVGAGGHAYHEHVVIRTIPERAALLTQLLVTL